MAAAIPLAAVCILAPAGQPAKIIRMNATSTPGNLAVAFVLWLTLLAAPGGAGTEDAPDANTKRDERYRRLVLGTWQDHYQGKRTMTVREDGTALMVVELSGLKAGLFASRLEFDMLWSIRDGHLHKRTIGGRPSGRVKLILSTMGDRVNEPILELTKDRLLLLDADGKTQYDWRRVPATKADGKPGAAK